MLLAKKSYELQMNNKRNVWVFNKSQLEKALQDYLRHECADNYEKLRFKDMVEKFLNSHYTSKFRV
jgi:hypothetical protein